MIVTLFAVRVFFVLRYDQTVVRVRIAELVGFVPPLVSFTFLFRFFRRSHGHDYQDVGSGWRRYDRVGGGIRQFPFVKFRSVYQRIVFIQFQLQRVLGEADHVVANARLAVFRTGNVKVPHGFRRILRRGRFQPCQIFFELSEHVIHVYSIIKTTFRL